MTYGHPDYDSESIRPSNRDAIFMGGLGWMVVEPLLKGCTCTGCGRKSQIHYVRRGDDVPTDQIGYEVLANEVDETEAMDLGDEEEDVAPKYSAPDPGNPSKK